MKIIQCNIGNLVLFVSDYRQLADNLYQVSFSADRRNSAPFKEDEKLHEVAEGAGLMHAYTVQYR